MFVCILDNCVRSCACPVDIQVDGWFNRHRPGATTPWPKCLKAPAAVSDRGKYSLCSTHEHKRWGWFPNTCLPISLQTGWDQSWDGYCDGNGDSEMTLIFRFRTGFSQENCHSFARNTHSSCIKTDASIVFISLHFLLFIFVFLWLAEWLSTFKSEAAILGLACSYFILIFKDHSNFVNKEQIRTATTCWLLRTS